MKLFTVLLLSVFLLAGMSTSQGDAPTWHDVTWEGTTNYEMLQQVRADIAYAKRTGRHLRAQHMSPGGPVFECLEIARVIRNASDAGMIIEIHGSGVVASCGTFVLASGTPGYRYISYGTVFLIHPPQSGSMYGRECVKWADDPKTEDEKIRNEILTVMSQAYMRYTGKLGTMAWITCGNEAVGVATALERGIADRAER